MKKILSLAIVAGLLFGAVPSYAADSGKKFNDVDGTWIQPLVSSWGSKGYLSGYEDGTFRPGAQITRAEFVTWFNKFHNLTATNYITYKDVDQKAWYYSAIAIATNAGYVGGYADGTFHPDQPITREEISAMVTRFLKLADSTDVTYTYFDGKGFSDWARGAAGAMITSKIMTGYADGTFQPKQNLTRAEALKVIDSSLSYKDESTYKGGIFNTSGTFGPSTGQGQIDGNATVSGDKVTLKNLKITGDLIVKSDKPYADVNLENVTVYGVVRVTSPGKLTIVDSILDKVALDGGAQLVAKGKGKAANIAINGAAVLDDQSTDKAAFDIIKVDAGVKSKTIDISGSTNRFEVSGDDNIISFKLGTSKNIIVNKDATNNSFNIFTSVIVESFTASDKTRVKGFGTIKYGLVQSLDVTFERTPDRIDNTYTGNYNGNPGNNNGYPYYPGTGTGVPSNDSTVSSYFLTYNVNEALDLYNTTSEGNFNGGYPVGSKAQLLAAINYGQSIMNNANRTQQTVNDAANYVNTAITDYKNKLNQTANMASLRQKLQDAKLKLSGATEGTQFGNYPVGSKTTLQAVVNGTDNFLNVNITRNQSDIDYQMGLLTQAVNDFDSKRIGGGSNQILTQRITDAQTIYANAVEGNLIDQYTPGSKSVLQVEIYKAQGALANANTRSQAEIDTSINLLNSAIAIFESGKVQANDSTILATETFKYQNEVSVKADTLGADVTAKVLLVKAGMIVDPAVTYEIVNVTHKDGFGASRYLKAIDGKLQVAEVYASNSAVNEMVTVRFHKNQLHKDLVLNVNVY